MEVEIVLVDIVDNQIETTHTKSLDRKKRDLDEVKKTTLDTNEKDEIGSNERIDRDSSGDVKREVRQLRPPPLGQTSWQYNNNYELSNVHREPQPSTGLGSERDFARDQGISLNYNPFLIPPSSQSNQFYKNGGGTNEFFQLSNFGNSYAPEKSAQSNAVTEFNSHKPFTVHTSFGLDDAQEQYNGKRPIKGGHDTTNDPFYPIADHKLPPRSSADNLPDNFSYFHLGNPSGKDERDSFHHSYTPQQQPKRLQQPQAPIYFLNKPSKVLSASTPKNQYIQFSTVGGFFNNNPTAFSPIIENHKKPQKLRVSTEKYNVITHRPIYREPAPVRPEPNLDDDSRYEIHDVDQPYVRPTSANRYALPPSSNPFYSKNVAGNVNGEKDQATKLYTYHLTTEEIKIPLPNKNKGFFIAQNSKHNDANVKVLTNKPIYAQSTGVPEKHHSSNKRPSGLHTTANKFIEENIRDSHRTQITKPKQTHHVQSQPNNFVLPNKVSTSTIKNYKVETTSLSDDDEYYYDDADDVTKIPTTKKQSNEIEQTTYRIDQRYTSTTGKTTTTTSTKLPQNIRINQSRPAKIQPLLTQEYFEYDDDDEYDDDANDDVNEFKYKLPPVNVSKFMPMSETAAPRPAYMITTTSRPKLSSTTTHKYTTKSHVSSVVPAIIKFPEDIFQGVRPALNQSTQRPYTLRTRTKTTKLPTKLPLTRTTETTTPTTTVNIANTYRPHTKNSGQDNSNNANRLKKPSKRPSSLKKHLWELDERLPNRYICCTN